MTWVKRPVQVEITAYGDEVPSFVNFWANVFIAREAIDEHSSNGDDLRRLDEILEDQRQRIVALGRRNV